MTAHRVVFYAYLLINDDEAGAVRFFLAQNHRTEDYDDLLVDIFGLNNGSFYCEARVDVLIASLSSTQMAYITAV